MRGVLGEKLGFTLVELLIVVAVLGILSAIAIPKFMGYQKRASNTSAHADLRNLSTLMASAHAENGVYPAF